MTDYNMNVVTSVNLTPYGLNVVKSYYDKLELDFPSHTQYHLRGNVFTAPLWEIMHIFGPIMYMGNPSIPFVENKITLKDDRL